MTSIDTKPLAKMLEAQPISAMRIILGTIGGLIIFVTGTTFFLIIHLGFLWVFICAFTIIYTIFYAIIKSRTMHDKAILEFANINGLVPVNEIILSKLLPPSLSEIGSSRKFSNGYQMQLDGRQVCIFDYSYHIKAEGSDGYNMFSVAVVQSQKSYPHIYLDGKKNGSDGKYKSWQKLPLEGDFNKYFDLYAENDSNIETLSFLTPDVMQIFIDTASLYDIEAYEYNLAVITANTSIYVKSNMERLLICLRALFDKIRTSDGAISELPDSSKYSAKLITSSSRVGYFIGYILAILLIVAIYYFQQKFS